MSEMTKSRAQEIFLGNGPEPTAQEERVLARIALDWLALRERAEPVAPVVEHINDPYADPDFDEPPAPVADDDSEIKWRDLALQFDGHRMQAICFLKQILKELPEGEFSTARDFLKSGPLPGEEVLRNRIAALAPPAPGVAGNIAITRHFDTIALEAAREIMCDVNRRHEFLGGEVQLLSRIQCRIDDACRAAMLAAAPGKEG
ncbi:hypothetical protein SMY45_001321 [Cronobacter sakazakii]|nr:hypothetical protein [Cronobacter sakazakii]